MSTKITIELDTDPGVLDPKYKHIFWLSDDGRYLSHQESDWHLDGWENLEDQLSEMMLVAQQEAELSCQESKD